MHRIILKTFDVTGSANSCPRPLSLQNPYLIEDNNEDVGGDLISKIINTPPQHLERFLIDKHVFTSFLSIRQASLASG